MGLKVKPKAPNDKKLETILKDQLRMKEMIEDDKINILRKKIEETSKKILDQEKLTTFAQNLCIPEYLKTAYLNADFKKVLDYFKSNYEVKTNNASILSSKQESSNIRNSFRQELIEFDEYPIEDFKTNEKIKIKLVLTENNRTMKEKTFRKLASPFITGLNIGDTKLGLIHSAITIGPWYLVWRRKNFFFLTHFDD